MATDTPIDTIPITVTSSLPTPVTAKSMNNVEFLVRFPPFPDVPENVEIISFKDFKERGISMLPGGHDKNTEVDACGVKTIVLPNSHSTDWCKTETKRADLRGKGGPMRKRKKRKTGTGANSGPTPDNWEEYWEDRGPAYRVRASYDPNLIAYERLCQGAYDFKELRPWPLAQKQSGPMYCWGEFLRFAGISANLDLVDTKAEQTKQASADDDSDTDYAEDEDDQRGILNPNNLTSMDAATKARDRGEAFLTDPALYLRVFFSSYARDRGIIWTDANLTTAPILMRFFINFLVDNTVLPPREEKAMKHDSTRRILDQALKELPITSKLAKAWPDNFHAACKSCWGSKAQVFVFDFDEPEPMQVVEAAAGSVTNDQGWGGPADEAAATTENQESNGWASGWGTGWDAGPPTNTASGIVTVDVDEEGEFDTRVLEVTENADENPITAEVASVDEWDKYEPPSLFHILGPTALPLTHTTGIVESSVRRIKAIFPPSSDTSKSAIAKDVSAEAVEKTLSRTFGIVVLEPWINWNDGEEPHLSMPKILDSSRGAVKKDGEVVNGGDVTTTLPPFDPHSDPINVLVDAAHIEFFSVGMACLGTWVQLARAADFEVRDPKKKGKKNAKMERYWYVEELLRVIPSFYKYCG